MRPRVFDWRALHDTFVGFSAKRDHKAQGLRVPVKLMSCSKLDSLLAVLYRADAMALTIQVRDEEADL